MSLIDDLIEELHEAYASLEAKLEAVANAIECLEVLGEMDLSADDEEEVVEEKPVEARTCTRPHRYCC
jgi:hypothetical protein